MHRSVISDPSPSYPTPRRHPRTLTEAFGPYTSHNVAPMRDPPRNNPVHNATLATVIGVLIAIALVAWWSA